MDLERRPGERPAPRGKGEVAGKPLSAELATSLDAAFPSLVLAYQDRLYAFALRLSGSARDAEEIAQDAFVNCYRALRRYPAERIRALALKAWLYQVTLNVFRNRVRVRRLETVPIELDEERGGGLASLRGNPAEQPEARFESVEERERLARLVAELPPRYRAAVILRFVEEWPYEEIASVLKQPVGTVKANVHRGVGWLRDRLLARDGADGIEWRYGHENRKPAAVR